MRESHVYIMTGPSDTLYTGVTSELRARVHQHKNKTVDGFTKKYNLTALVYYEARLIFSQRSPAKNRSRDGHEPKDSADRVYEPSVARFERRVVGRSNAHTRARNLSPPQILRE